MLGRSGFAGISSDIEWLGWGEWGEWGEWGLWGEGWPDGVRIGLDCVKAASDLVRQGFE